MTTPSIVYRIAKRILFINDSDSFIHFPFLETIVFSHPSPVILEKHGIVIAASGDPSKCGRFGIDSGPVMNAVPQPQVFHPLDPEEVTQTQIN
jgi:hypothetical protein